MISSKIALPLILFFSIELSAFSQEKIDMSQHLQLFDISFPSTTKNKISTQDMLVKLTNYIFDTSYVKEINSKVPTKSALEIRSAIDNDKVTFFKNNERVQLFTRSDVFEKHKNYAYAVPPTSLSSNSSMGMGLGSDYEKQQEQIAIKKKKSTLLDEELVIYLFSNIYYDKTKKYCVLLVVKSVVGNETTQIFIYKKDRQKWSEISSIK